MGQGETRRQVIAYYIVTMDKLFDYEDFLKRIDKAKNDEEKRFKEAKRKYNVAALVDFATNLISLAAYKKGARFSIGTSNIVKELPQYISAKRHYDDFLTDYNGKIAQMNLFKSKEKRNVKSGSSLRHVGFIGNNQRRPAITLRSGSFERSLNDFKTKYNRKNYSL